MPADLLVGDDEQAMGEWADRLRAAFAPRPAPRVDGAGSFGREGGKAATRCATSRAGSSATATSRKEQEWH